MQWWNEFVGWFFSDAGWRIFSTAILPFLAIVVAGLIAAAIGHSSTKRILALNHREQRAAAVTAMIGSARRAAVWNTLSDSEQRHADHAALEADIRLRLLSVSGASLASDWCAHEIVQMKKNAISFSFQAEQSLLEFRNRLIDWHTHPSRAKKLFKNDLDSWAYDTSLADQDLVSQQKAWAEQQSAALPPEPASRREVSTPAAGAVATATRQFTRPVEIREPADATASEAPTSKGDDESAFSPVPVSHVRERINPNPALSDEVR
jgi:hypothetical protein